MDLYLHENDTSIKSEPEFEHVNVGSFIKSESLGDQTEEEKCIEEVDSKVDIDNILMDVKEELPTSSSDLEHDYCHEIKIKTEEDADVSVSDTTLLDHNYSLPYKDCNDSSPSEKTNEDKFDSSVEQGNNLIFGLDESYRDDRRQTETDVSKSKVSMHIKKLLVTLKNDQSY